ncbi:MAG: preprotein translocase subunit YajC [Clostridia bacterium]|nr:preprotein translocase subunit YajC [Clostridia bacterium]
MLNNLLAGTTGGNSTMITVVFIVIIVAMIGLLIWQTISGKKKQKEAQNMVNQLKKGDRVKTIGGVCGFVVEINDAENTFVLETGTDDNKSYVKFDKGAIYQTAPANGSAVEAAAQAEKAEETVTEEKVEPATEEAPKKAKRKRRLEDEI